MELDALHGARELAEGRLRLVLGELVHDHRLRVGCKNVHAQRRVVSVVGGYEGGAAWGVPSGQTVAK